MLNAIFNYQVRVWQPKKIIFLDGLFQQENKQINSICKSFRMVSRFEILCFWSFGSSSKLKANNLSKSLYWSHIWERYPGGHLYSLRPPILSASIGQSRESRGEGWTGVLILKLLPRLKKQRLADLFFGKGLNVFFFYYLSQPAFYLPEWRAET